MCEVPLLPSALCGGLLRGQGGGKVEATRIGIVGIVLEETENVHLVNDILHQYGELIVGRMGIPYRHREVSVISLIVDGTTDELSAMTGKLGKISGVTIKSALTKK